MIRQRTVAPVFLVNDRVTVVFYMKEIIRFVFHRFTQL